MPKTEYFEVRPQDTDVGAFLASHVNQINIWALPSKIWAAREDGKIVALLTLTTFPYVAIDLIIGDPASRPFMRILRLWRVAEQWLSEQRVPAVCAPIKEYMLHFQTLVKRLGFVPGGEELDEDGNVIETIFIKKITPSDTPGIAVH
jgi:hypothetical protein